MAAGGMGLTVGTNEWRTDIMEFGLFNVPYSLDYPSGHKTAKQVIDWDLQLARWADEYGWAEVFFAEHYTIGHEPSPAPDLMIAAASQITTDVRLGAAAHLLPYHNPINLAHRLMWLDHMTGGRYICGVAPGAFPTDAQLFGTGKANADMMSEALEIMLAIWTREGPFRIEGKYWTLDMPGYTDEWRGPHLRPLQQPHPPLAIVGMQPTSPSLAEAGRRGLQPISQELGVDVLRQHWATYSQSAIDAGREPKRDDWRVLRDIFVAETDAEAMLCVLEGGMGATWRAHTLGAFKAMGFGQLLAPVAEDELTVEYLAENFWLIGSPDTVVEKITALYEETGGFGTLLSLAYDYMDDPEPYRRSFELLGREVAPRLAKLDNRVAAAVSADGVTREIEMEESQ